MNFGLENKGVLVMASSGGIGRGVATESAREGSKVMLFSRCEENLAATAAEIGAATGNEPKFTVGDITSDADIQNAVERTVCECGGLWALFNNTGGPPARMDKGTKNGNGVRKTFLKIASEGSCNAGICVLRASF